MTGIRALGSTVALAAAAAFAADATTLKCEAWHPRLGQNPDVSFAINFAAKTCDGQPCAISDAAFKWQVQNGRYDVNLDRTTGEGTATYLGDLLFTYRNCSPPAVKP